MDNIGSLQLAWANGYKGNRTKYITEDVICFKCGDTIKFVSEDGKESMYVPPSGEGMGPMTVHSVNKVFAYSENNIKPRIFCFHYPSFIKFATLTDGAQLEYLALTFSTSEYLASISGVPDYQLIIWRYTDQVKLCVQDLTQVTPNCLSFNPGNWRQLSIGTAKELSVWNVEQNNTQFLIKKQCHFHRLPEKNFVGKFKFPPERGESARNEPASRSSSRQARVNFQLPISAIAGLTGDDLEKFEDYRDDLDRMIPVTMSWQTSGELLVGCSGGQLISVDVETDSLTVLSLINAMPEPDPVVEGNKATAGESRDQIPVTPSQTSRQESQDMSIRQESITEKTDGRRESRGKGMLKKRGSAAEKMGDRQESHDTPRRQDSLTEKVVSWRESHDTSSRRDSITEKMGGRRDSYDTSSRRDSITEKMGGRRDSHDTSSRRDSITEKMGGRRDSYDTSSRRDSITEKVGGRRQSHDMPSKRDSITEKIGEEDHVQDKKQKDDSKSIKEHDHDENQPKDSGGHAVGKVTKKDGGDRILPGSLNCMTLHQRGLFVAGNDGVLRVLKITKDEFAVVEHQDIGVPVTSLSFNLSHHMLCIGSSKGSIHLLKPKSISNVKLLFDVHYGNFLTACGLAGSSEYCVTVRESGEVQVWKSDTGNLMCSLSIGVKACSLATSPLAHMAVVGSETGYAYIIDLNTLDNPRVVYSIHLHRAPIRCIAFNEIGQYFFTGSTDGLVFVVDGRPSNKFEPLGYVNCEGDVRGLSTFMKDGETRVVVSSDISDSPSPKSPANKLTSFILPADLLNGLSSKHRSLKCDFRDEIINQLSFNFPDPVYGIVLTDDYTVYCLCSVTRHLLKFHISQDIRKKINLEEEVPETVAKSVISSRLEYRRRRQQVVSPAITSRRRMSVVGSGMADQSGGAGSGSTGPSAMVDVSSRLTVSGTSGASQSGGAGGGHGASEGVGRRMSIFGSMSEQGPAPEPLFIAPEHKEVSSLDLLKIRRASMAEGQMSGIMKLVTMMKASESLIDKDTSEALAAQEAEKNKDPFLTVSEQATGHQLFGGCISMSLHHKWLASGGGDGQLIIRPIQSLDDRLIAFAHNYWRGGVFSFSFSPDSQLIFTSGFDGTLCCFKWNYTASGHLKGRIAADVADALLMRLNSDQRREDDVLMKMKVWNQPEKIPVTDKEQEAADVEKEIDKAIENDLIYTPSPPAPPEDATWEEIKRNEAQLKEEKQFADEKLKLRIEIRNMRRQLQQMMRENEEVPAIEKLPNHEFDLDVDEQKRLQEQCEIEVQKLREEKEYQNIAKMYLTEVMRKECWDDMMVKGRGILAFNSSLEVYNYPLKERTKQELRELEVIQTQRRIEIAELQARKEIADVLNNISTDPATAEEEPVETDDVKLQLLREKSALMGSLGFEVGGESDLFYSQFELASKEQKYNQVVLLQDAIYRIRVKFNKNFDEVFLKKEQEIQKIKEKNKRIRKILEDLNLPGNEVYEPELGPIEKPEMMLTTADDEVKVEKYLTPEQWQKLEEDQKKEEERKLKERGDNWRERGLDQMMGGVLEIKREDELRKDVPIPAFMQEKKEADWTEEERIIAEEYLLKVKALEEEREKFRKQLDLELKKLQTAILEGTQAFDDVLHQLFIKKVKAESVIYQEELKILRLRYSMLTEEEFTNYEKELQQNLDTVKQSVQQASSALGKAKGDLDAYLNEYDIHVADDKVHERMFRREFQGLPNPLIDQLFRHYKKRPRGQKAKIFDCPAYGPKSLNPYFDRPPTAKRNEDERFALKAAMAELNHEKNIPEGVDNQTWDHLCAYRLEKMEKEWQIKQEALTLAEMQAFVHKRQEDEQKLRAEIEEIIETINKLRDSRRVFSTDLEVQLLLKQGQVEVDPGPFIPNYKTALLIHREVVEDLNKKIRQLGERKIASMVESKDFRKGIIVLEWEHKKMKMEMEDLKNRMRDIINMKVTREIQVFLAADDYDALKNQEMATLEQTIAMQERHHERRIKEKKKALEIVKKSVYQMLEKNNNLESELEKLNVTVSERRHIREVNPEKLNELDREQRYREIVQRRKLIDLAKAQAQEIAMLRTELERLRMRTFPALVSLDQ